MDFTSFRIDLILFLNTFQISYVRAPGATPPPALLVHSLPYHMHISVRNFRNHLFEFTCINCDEKWTLSSSGFYFAIFPSFVWVSELRDIIPLTESQRTSTHNFNKMQIRYCRRINHFMVVTPSDGQSMWHLWGWCLTQFPCHVSYSARCSAPRKGSSFHSSLLSFCWIIVIVFNSLLCLLWRWSRKTCKIRQIGSGARHGSRRTSGICEFL